MTFIMNMLKNHDAKLLFTDRHKLWNRSRWCLRGFLWWQVLFHLSNYPKVSKFFDTANIKVIGKMKDKFKGEIMSEYVGLKPKMYSLVSVDVEENKKSKRSQ